MLSLSLRSASRNTTRRLFSTSRTRTKAAAKRPSESPSQHLSRPSTGRQTILRLGGLAALVGGGTYYALSNEDDDALSSALRAYIVYSACSLPWVIDHAPGVLDVLLSIPIASSITEAIIRHTFFAQFVGAESATECLPLLHRLRECNIGALFAYSVEVQDPTKGEHAGAHKQTHKHMVEEMIRSIDVAADFEASRRGDGSHDGTDRNELLGAAGRRTWVAVKVTALAPDSSALIRFSRYILQHRPTSVSPVPFPGTPDASDLHVLDLSPSPNNAKNAHGSGSPDGGLDVGILTAQDIASLRELREDLVRICTRAEERGVRIIIDAEYSWYQPAIDAFCYDLMRKFNAKPSFCSSSFSALYRFFGVNTATTAAGVQPLVYATYQAYLRRTPEHLKHSMRDAKKHGYTLGVKLVRGAYHPHELSMHGHSSSSNSSVGDSHAQSISPEPLPPVWMAKSETDACYNACASLLVDELTAITRSRLSTPSSSAVGVLFGTHNAVSCDHILKSLVRSGLAREEIIEGATTTTEGENQGKAYSKKTVQLGDDVGERVTFGQLYGMHDELAEKLLECTRANAPVLIKYVPYGALTEVMPYLSRRAIENKSVLGNGAAEAERRRAGKEIRKILFGSWA